MGTNQNPPKIWKMKNAQIRRIENSEIPKNLKSWRIGNPRIYEKWKNVQIEKNRKIQNWNSLKIWKCPNRTKMPKARKRENVKIRKMRKATKIQEKDESANLSKIGKIEKARYRKNPKNLENRIAKNWVFLAFPLSPQCQCWWHPGRQQRHARPPPTLKLGGRGGRRQQQRDKHNNNDLSIYFCSWVYVSRMSRETQTRTYDAVMVFDKEASPITRKWCVFEAWRCLVLS